MSWADRDASKGELLPQRAKGSAALMRSGSSR